MARLISCWVLVFFVESSRAQTTYMRVVNDMQDTGELWSAGVLDGRRLDWRNDIINRKRTKLVAFYGNDPFYLVVRIQGVDYHAGQRNLIELVAKDPNAVLELGGVFAYGWELRLVWNSRLHRWEQHRVAVQRRVAV